MIVVNPSTRQFNIPGADLVFGVTADSGSVVKEFQCPRYVGNKLDLAACFIRMNYRNANGEIDSYLVENVTVDGDNIVFGWELSPKVTMYKGNISFVMCATGPDTKVKWHTTLGRGQVLEGLEPDNSTVESETADVVVQLLAMVERQTTAVEKTGADQAAVVKAAAKTAQDSAVAQIEAKGASTLATIPENYTVVQNAVRGAANAIRGKVSGEVIRVDDVSPMEHYPAVKVHGKNFIPFPYKQTTASLEGVTFTVLSDGGIQVSGTPTGYTSISIYEGAPLVKSGKAVLSYSGDFENLSLAIAIYDNSAKVLFSSETWASSSPIVLNLDLYPSAARWIVYMKRGTVGMEMRGVAYPQVELGEVATEYTPYINPTTVTVTGCGKNILPYPLLTTGGTFGGVTVTSENNALILNGTVTKNTAIPLFIGNIRVKGKYTISGLTGGSGATYYIQPYIGDTTVGGTTDGPRTYEWDGVLTRLNLNVVTGVTFNNLRVSPMIEHGDVMTGFELYKGESQIPTADGTVTGLKAVSPTMTLLTDTPGVTIDCEYGRDTNKVIAEILEKITALGG